MCDSFYWFCWSGLIKAVKTHSHDLHKQANAQKTTNPCPMRVVLGKCIMWLRFTAQAKITQAASLVWNKSTNDLLSSQKCALNMMGGNDFMMTLPSNFLASVLPALCFRARERDGRVGDGAIESRCSVTMEMRLFWSLAGTDDTAHLWRDRTITHIIIYDVFRQHIVEW